MLRINSARQQKRLLTRITAFIAISQALWSVAFAQAQDSGAKVSLNVAVFGYIPDGDSVLVKLKQKFEALNSDCTVSLTLLDPYHDADQGMVSLQHFKEFDIVETDLCRFADLISLFGGLDALPATWTWYPAADSLVGGAKVFVNSNGKTYAVPHWICENFLVRWSNKEGGTVAPALSQEQEKPTSR